MRISAKIDYACRALLELSLHWPNTAPRQVAEIARDQKIPMKFLTHILIALKSAGYVQSARGKSGGYFLLQSPAKIKLVDVVRNFGGLVLNEEAQKSSQTSDVMRTIWREIDDLVLKNLEPINFETIVNRKRAQAKAIVYDI